MKRIPVPYIILFLSAIIADQVSKMLVDSHFALYSSRALIGDFLRLTYIRNEGVAFGFSFGNKYIVFAVTIAVILFLIYLIVSGELRPSTITGRIAAVLVLSGALGNQIDRIRYGEVIDFIEMGIGKYRWPVYNFADIYLTVGMFLLIYTYVIKNRDDSPSEPSA